MALMRTSNPALNENIFRNQSGNQNGQFGARAIQYGERFGGSLPEVTSRMTLNGTINKTGVLLVLAMATAAWTWFQFLQAGNPAEGMSAVMPWMMGGMIGGLVFAMITIFKKEWASVTAPAYALLEGLVLGSVSALFELRFPGIAIQAVGLTFGTLVALLLAYRSGMIRVTDNFRLGVVAATGGIALFYLVTFVLSFFGVHFTSIYG